MAIDGIYYTGNTNLTTSTKASSTGSNSLNMEDFINLMVAQLENQDMYNTVDNTEYMSQLAQFSMIESLNSLVSSMENLNEVNLATYSSTMVGKDAIITVPAGEGTEQDESGNSVIRGRIDGVTYYEGNNYVIVDGKQYPVTDVAALYEAGTYSEDPQAKAMEQAAEKVAEELADALAPALSGNGEV
ncbi:MAG: hypothetical protein K6F52_02320 [Clostridia bacterium]|nr:hypothetical protein [Clostridia bacterium]